MFGSIGGFEILILLAIGLLVFGPRRLPEVGRWVARGLGELRKAAADVKSAVEKEADLSDVTRAATDIRKAVNTEARKLFDDLEAEASIPPGGAARNAPGEPPPAAPGEAPPVAPAEKGGEEEAKAPQAPPGAPGEAGPAAPSGKAGGEEKKAPEPPEGTRHR